MNKEVIKAMKKKKNRKIKKWYREHYRTIWRTILFPLYFTELAIDKFKKYRNNKIEWNEERVKEILNYYIPRRAEWVEEENLFFFFDNGYGWDDANKYLKRKDKRFWKKYVGFCGGQIREYLIEEFELEGFEKNVNDKYNGRTEITFKKIEK